ncbi:DUF3761 domain-containing protein [Nocardia sp. NPDC052112]|uniref:DUF3761 domain-containing protein n=1 Tax=Nocardia sp. NPDC052112 TaxID=3155646 RepID=UPI003435E000
MRNRFTTLVGTGIALASALTLLLSGCAAQSSGPGRTAATASITSAETSTTSPQPTTTAPPPTSITPTTTVAPPPTSVAPPAAAPIPPAPAPPAPLAQSQSTCGNDSYLNADNQCIHRPQSAPAAPPGATARCADGTYSYSQTRSGTCSHHGGVTAWL